MNHKRLIALAFVTALGVGVAAGGLRALEPQAAPAPSGPTAGAPMLASMEQGWGRHGQGGHGRHFCGAMHGKRMERMITFVEGFSDFTPEQQAAWEGLTETLQDSRAQMRETCEDLREADGPRHAPEKLARMEAMLTARLDALRKVRPAFEAFYETLDERKREALDTLFSRHRRHG
jgi:hypothetical protein